MNLADAELRLPGLHEANLRQIGPGADSAGESSCTTRFAYGCAMPLSGSYEPGRKRGARTQAEIYEATDGREAHILRGRPIIVLTSVGARTGTLRKTALMRVEHEGRYAAVASEGGQPMHPAWYHNLVAHPHVELQDGAMRRDYRARQLDGAEKAEWWARALDTWPDYEKYQSRTERQIPVFLLEPFDPPAG